LACGGGDAGGGGPGGGSMDCGAFGSDCATAGTAPRVARSTAIRASREAKLIACSQANPLLIRNPQLPFMRLAFAAAKRISISRATMTRAQRERKRYRKRKRLRSAALLYRLRPRQRFGRGSATERIVVHWHTDLALWSIGIPTSPLRVMTPGGHPYGRQTFAKQPGLRIALRQRGLAFLQPRQATRRCGAWPDVCMP
jgi:hypothetical protein